MVKVFNIDRLAEHSLVVTKKMAVCVQYRNNLHKKGLKKKGYATLSHSLSSNLLRIGRYRLFLLQLTVSLAPTNYFTFTI